MADWIDERNEYGGASRKRLTGQQSYFVEVPSSASAAGLSVVSFEAVERMGEPYTVTIQLTHPLELDRADYLNKDATFVIDPADGTAPRKFAGCITCFSKTRQTQDFSAYQIVIEPLVARLRLTHASRIHQHKTAPQIIEAILRRHGLAGHQFRFKTRRKYPEHRFHFQYQMSDWDYIRLLMEQEGLYSYFEPGKFGEMVVFGDDIDHYLYLPELRVPYRETAGLESGTESVFAIQTHARTVPASYLVADYNPDQSWERFKAEANVARKDKTTYGQPYVYGTHHLDQEGAKWEAQLRHEAAIAWQVIYEGESNVLELRLARILRMDRTLPDAPNGQVIIEVTHSGGRDAAYRNTYKAIPSDRRFRLRLNEASWPRINGTLSARITSPGKYKYAYLTQHGHYVVRFDVDFDEWSAGGESVPLRLAKPFAGALQTGFHFPLIDGTEVAIAFRDGNPNKPYIAHVHHHSHHADLITNQDRWLSRNAIVTQSNNMVMMEDWEGQEFIHISTEYGGKTQLNMGYLVDGKRQKRGEGFELRSDAQGSIRGNGLLLSADVRKGASGQQLDMQEALSELRLALDRVTALAQATTQANATPADSATQSALKSALDQLKTAGIVATAPGGVAFVTPKSIQHSASENIIVTSGRHVDISAVKRIAVAAGDLISLCAHKLGLKLFAAKGKVEIQAQTDALDLFAAKQLHIASANEDVLVTAKGKLTLLCGGAYIKLEGGSVEIGCPGDFKIKSNSFSYAGPVDMSVTLPILPNSEFKTGGNYGLSH